MATNMTICKAVFDGNGSEMRSGNCPIEHGCSYWLINGVKYRAFGKMAEFRGVEGQEYDLKFKYDGGRLLKYCKVL